MNADGTPYQGGSVTAIFTTHSPGEHLSEQHSLVLTQSYIPGDGDFTIAYSWPYSAGPGQPVNDCIQNGVVNPLLTPSDDGGYDNPNPYYSTFNDYSDYFDPGNAGYIGNSTDRNALWQNLEYQYDPLSHTHTENFYWWGHGSAKTISGGMEGTTTSAATMSTLLANTMHWWGPDFKGPYRFVFFDCCEAAKDTTWAYAFGIPRTITESDVETHPERQRAFLGYTGDTYSWNDETEYDEYEDTLQFFFELWQDGFTLSDCVDACSYLGWPGPATDPYHEVTIQIPIGLPLGFNYSWGKPPGSLKKIYGYPEITRTGN